MVPDTFAIARECRANNLQKWWLKLEEKNRPTNRPSSLHAGMGYDGTTKGDVWPKKAERERKRQTSDLLEASPVR